MEAHRLTIEDIEAACSGVDSREEAKERVREAIRNFAAEATNAGKSSTEIFDVLLGLLGDEASLTDEDKVFVERFRSATGISRVLMSNLF